MKNIANEITNLSYKYDKPLKKTTEPLLQQFGITYFCLQTVTNDGLWSLIGNNAPWLEFSANNQYYLHDPSLINPRQYHSGITFADAHDHQEFRRTLYKGATEVFDLGHALAMVNKTTNGCEFAFFGAPLKHTKVISTYIARYQTLRHFVQHFKLATQSILYQSIDHQVDLKQLKPTGYDALDNILTIDSALDIGHSRLPELSLREQECLYHYLQGKTAKETAKILGLSYRTVEEYIFTLKSKLNCRHKRDLLKLFNLTNMSF